MPAFEARREERGARAEQGHAGGRRHLPQDAEVRVARVAVVQHRRATDQQRAEQQVPHHPAGRRVPEHPVAGMDVAVEAEDLGMLEDDPAVPVDDRLRQPGRARRVEHPQRVVERHGLEPQRLGGTGEEVVPRQHVRSGDGIGVEIREEDRPLERRQLGPDRLDDVAPIEALAAVGVAVDGDEDLGRDLGEPVDQAARPEVGRAARPDRPDARAGEQGDDRLGDVRDDGDDPITATDAEPAEAGRRGRDRSLRARPTRPAGADAAPTGRRAPAGRRRRAGRPPRHS